MILFFFLGPVVEERTIITTYEDDIPINEEVTDHTVPLNDEEREKWNRMLQEAQDDVQIQVRRALDFFVFIFMFFKGGGEFLEFFKFFSIIMLLGRQR